MGGGRVGGRDPEPSQVIYPAPSLVGQWTSNGLCVCLCVVLLCREVVSVAVWLGLVGWAGPARTRGNCRKQQKTGEPTTRGCGGGLWWGAVVGDCGGGLWWWTVVVGCGGGLWGDTVLHGPPIPPPTPHTWTHAHTAQK